VLAGIVVGAALSLGTDLALGALGITPPIRQWHTPWLFGLATAYRTIYNILGSYAIAWLAPNRPMGHALFAGVLGLIVSAIGTAVAWNRAELGPRRYPLALAVLALPSAWVGAKLWLLGR